MSRADRDTTRAGSQPRRLAWLGAIIALVGMLYAVPLSAQPAPQDDRRAELLERLRARRMYFLIDNAGVTEEELPALRSALEVLDAALEPLHRQRRQNRRAMRRLEESGGSLSEAEASQMLESMQQAEQARLDAYAALGAELSSRFPATRQLEIIMSLRRFEEELRRRQERAREPRGERRGRR